MCVTSAVPVPLDVEGVAGEDETVDIVVVADVDVVIMVQMKLLPLAATMYHALFCLRRQKNGSSGVTPRFIVSYRDAARLDNYTRIITKESCDDYIVIKCHMTYEVNKLFITYCNTSVRPNLASKISQSNQHFSECLPRLKYSDSLVNDFLVSKETVVLRRWERSKQKFGFTKRVDKG